MLKKFLYVTILQCIDKLHSETKNIFFLFTSSKTMLAHSISSSPSHSLRESLWHVKKQSWYRSVVTREMATNDKWKYIKKEWKVFLIFFVLDENVRKSSMKLFGIKIVEIFSMGESGRGLWWLRFKFDNF